jgi:hypothetical protein
MTDTEQTKHAKFELLLLDIAHRREQVEQLKTIDIQAKLRQYRLEPVKVLIAGLTAGAALFAAGAAFMKIFGG